jgi:hypothetical protein
MAMVRTLLIAPLIVATVALGACTTRMAQVSTPGAANEGGLVPATFTRPNGETVTLAVPTEEAIAENPALDQMKPDEQLMN